MTGQTVQAQLQFAPAFHDATFEKYDGLQLIGRVHISRTFIDHQKWGFFKVALAPIGVVDGVNVQIRSAESLTNTLDIINTCNASLSKFKHVEFRHLQISLLGDQASCLSADNAKIGRADVLDLSHVSVSSDGEAMTLPKATLQVSGSDCGCLRWNGADGHEQLFLFQKP